MSDEKEKLNSDEVPGRFTEWLLAMGCPVEKVPSLYSAKQMCRGQYYIVWRSLMEEVEPKNSIRHKRLSVFCDDLRKINDNNGCDKNKMSVIEPDELALWREQTDLRVKVIDAESRITQAKEDLDHLVDKVSSKLSNRNTSNSHSRDIERRVLLLQRVAEHLETKKADLQETINIANSLSYTERNVETENKLDKCISGLRRQTPRSSISSHLMMSTGNPVACSSIASTISEIDYENNIATLVKCRGDALWPQLYERRAGLCVAISQACAQQPSTNSDKMTSKSALAHTAALHCSIALEAMKNKAHMKQAEKMYADTAVPQLNDRVRGDACEYIVLETERTCAQARVTTLRRILDEIESRQGFFKSDSRYTGDKNGARQQISAVDKNILSKKEELKKLLRSLAVMERKIANIRQCLETVFSCLKNGISMKDMGRFRDIMSLPQESLATIQQFYKERRTMQKKMDISLDLDMSASNSFMDYTENTNPTFIDELRMYLQRFDLEKNRKLVLENGEKIWVHETLKSSLHRIRSKWQTEEMPCTLLCPSVGLARNLRSLTDEIQWKAESESIVGSFDCCAKENYIDIDITSKVAKENEEVDKIKKRLNEKLICLQKVNRALDVGGENIEFWNSNTMKQYISSNRTIDGKTYKDYENLYMHSLNM